jgi:MFS family permease
MFQAAIVVFLIGSLICGFSPEIADFLDVSGINVMIAGRAVQGLGGGGLMSLALAVIGDVIPPRERGKYQGFFAACSASRRWPVRCWAAGSPTTSAGNGSSSSTFRSVSLR